MTNSQLFGRRKQAFAPAAPIIYHWIARSVLAFCLAVQVWPLLLQADPSGALQLNLLGNSDTRVSLPTLRLKAATATVQTTAGNLVLAQGSPGWTTNQFVYASGVQSDHYYLLFRTGARAGSFFDVTANDAAGLTVNLGTSSLSGVASGDQFDIVPHWTLATVFPNGQGVHPSPSPGSRDSEVFAYDASLVGIDFSSSKTYYFWNGNWRQVGQGTSIKNDDVLPPGSYFVVRHNVSSGTTLTINGAAATFPWAIPLAANAVAQDYQITLARPVPVALKDSGLIESGAFLPSVTPGSRVNELFVFDDSFAGKDKSSSATYYYWNNAWRRVGAGVADVGTDLVFQPFTGVLLRRNSASGSVTWTNQPPNLIPAINLASPPNASTFSAPTSVTITATASAVLGTISKVEFFDGGALLSSTNNSPFTFTWSNPPAGQHSITAVATDTWGSTNSSSAVQVTILPANQPPVVDAGTDQTITLPASATLVGSASDDGLPAPPGALSFQWLKVSGPDTVTFADANATNTTASFSSAGNYVLRLSADDGAATTTDDIAITVSPANQPPVVDAGPDQAITLPAGATLAGSASDDGLPVPPGTLSFQWLKVSGPGTVTFADANATNTTASFSSAGNYVLRLSADDSAATTTDDVTISVSPANQPPVVDAGTDQTITLPAGAALAGSASDDGLPAPPGALSFQWLKVSGPGTVTFVAANATNTTASFSSAGNYVLRLSADDGAATTTDDIAITVSPANQPPVVDAGPDQTITLPAGATLAGSASDDGLPVPPGALSFQWLKVSGPGTVIFADATATNTTVSFSSAGNYVLRLSADDGAATTTDDIAITVSPANQPPVVDAGTDQTITLPAGATLAGSASDDGLPAPPGALSFQWLKVSGPGTVTFADANATNTTASFSSAGTYDLQLKVEDGEFPSSADVIIVVNPVPNLPPSITLTNPVDGAVFTPPASIALAVDASDTDGSVVSVDYYEGATWIGTATNSPFALIWNSVGSGSYALTAVATDNGGATSTSSVVNVTVSYVPPPANDNFVDAQALTGSSGTVTGQNVNATLESGEPFHAGSFGGASVWYQWTAGSSSQTLIDTVGSDFDTLLGVYVGTGVSLLNVVGGNNNIDPNTPQSRLSFTSIAGTTYYFAVDGYNGAIGNIVLNWSQTSGPPPPLNDGFATAEILTGTVGSLTSSTTDATKEPGEPDHAGNPGGKSVWYQWTAPTDNMTTFDTLGSPFNTLLAIYTGDSVGALTEIASNDNYISGTLQSRVRFQAYAGTNYFIAVDGTNGASGKLVLSWNQEGLGNSPDLTVLAGPYYFTNQTFISTDCAVVEGMVQAGARRLMLFTIRTLNQGAIDWFIGNPVGNTNFVWAPCHAHYHYNNFMQYRFLDRSGQLIVPGFKVGFCISDSLRWDTSANSTVKYHCLMQGIQKGWEDIYASHTTGQWIDITGVPDGYYSLEVTVNPYQFVEESNYTNNTYVMQVTLGTPVPPNNDFANAQAISGISGKVIGQNNFASKESGEPNHASNTGGHSIWYSWTAVNNDSVIFSTKTSTYNTLLAVYTGSAVNSLTTVASNDDIGGVYGSLVSRLDFAPTAGATYYIAIDGYNGAAGTNTLNWIQTPPPANDAFANAQVITGGAGSITGTNILATKESGEPNHAGNAGGRSLWYLWSAPATGTVTIDTIGSEFDTTLGVYTGNAYGALTTIASNDDMGGGGSTSVWSRVTFTATQGVTYRIALDGYNSKKGNTVLNWNQPNAGTGSLARNHPSHYSLALAGQPVELTLACSALATGGIMLRIDGAPKQNCVMQFSSDLVNWNTLIDFELDDTGHGVLIDRAKIEGRPNLNDPWCGNSQTGIYIPPQKHNEAVYYRVVAEGTTASWHQ